jgi:hypothetical protein
MNTSANVANYGEAFDAPQANCLKNSLTISISYDYIDGTGDINTSTEGFIHGGCNAPITVQYNYFKNTPKDFIHWAGGPNSIFTMRYNYGEGMARAAGAHGQPFNNYGDASSPDESWNTFYGDGGEGKGAGVTALCNFDGGIGEPHPNCNNNSFVGGVAYIVYMTGESGSAMQGTVTVNNNYMDFRNAYGPYYPNIWHYTTVSTGNINMSDGYACNAYASASSC